MYDHDGATLTPGLTDGHTHPVLGTEHFTGLDLSGCRTIMYSASPRESLGTARLAQGTTSARYRCPGLVH